MQQSINQPGTESLDPWDADSRQYDTIIIGSGPGGYATALRTAELGGRVALVEQAPVVGGVCLNRGCIPTKALLTATQVLEQADLGAAMGINIGSASIDYQKLQDYQDRMVDAMTGGLSSLLKQRGITVVQGHGTIVGDGLVEVTDDDGNRTRLTTCDTILATGSHARPLEELPFDDLVIDTDRALTLKPFPRRALIIGSGAVALEFATIWNQAGCQVTLLVRHDRVLSHWGRRTGQIMTRELKRQGIQIITHARCSGGHRLPADGGMQVDYQPTDDKGQAGALETDLVLVAIGRDPNTNPEHMKELGIDLDEQGQVLTDSQGRTSRDRVWALGDITPGHHLAHRAFQQGITLADAASGLDPEPVNEATIPRVVFSSPQAAAVGFSRQEAEDDPSLNQVKETIYPMMANSRMRMSGLQGTLSLITACQATDLEKQIVVGLEMVSPQASENIAEAQQLVGNQIPLHRAAGLIHPHPTFSEAIGEALLKADGRPLNMR
ncbi:dihydrolipoyl dehydrogenase family protein [Bifidobacterium asteroides]|uniref:dihydrolipoyl dehydrogenase family protein n=1 Tax=Bifidobacterium asteroides TaxID=1684 RepID=UPI0027416420|nr:FAD-dependent oxidoreductase [Bifidobacterium asteroides]WLT10103.1 FAD-dependent oxidoreductase [Bifidobacterium asteroides]